MAYSPAKKTDRSNEGNTSGSDDTKGSASTPASEMNKKGKNDDKATKVFDPKTGRAITKTCSKG